MVRTGAITYQNFTAPPTPARRAAQDPARHEATLARARGQARAEGFEEGVAQAEARFESALSEQLAAISAALSESTALADEARSRAALDACDALRRFLSAVAPRLASTGAAEAAIDAVALALETAPRMRPDVEVPPEAVEITARAFAREGIACAVRPNDRLPEGGARIVWRSGFDEIDLRPAIQEALSALGATRPMAEAEALTQTPIAETG